MEKSYHSRFVCPDCGCEHLVEVRHEVKATIGAIRKSDNDDDRDEIVYDKRFIHAVEPEDIDYRCLECGYVPKDQRGEVVHGIGGLCDWLTKQVEVRMNTIEFACPSCGGHHLDDNVEIDDEGFCQRTFCCHECGMEVCDEEESILRKIVEWGQKCSGRPQ
jgi:hypothetical protein